MNPGDKTIHKWRLFIDDRPHDVPGTVVHVDTQEIGSGAQTGLFVWTLTYLDNPTFGMRKYQVFGTGHAVPLGALYVGTTMDGPFVWHVFDVTEIFEEKNKEES